jgi:diguanylate cyclase (GGDEF)-like protein
VLLVEDSPGDAELAARVLSRYADPRFEVVRARTLLEAIALARGSGYGAILLDLSLPDLSGLASVRELALAVPRTPIVVLTGTDSHASAIEAIRHGAQDYLVKGERDAAGLARAIQLAIERKACEAQLAERAHFDELTGLANRALFRDRLAQALARARRKGERTALLFIDLDGFKAVNDTLGHAAGDEVLRLAATRFRCAVRASETLARFGGDEFVVLIEGLAEAAGARRTAQRLVAAMRAPFTIDGKEVRVTPSIGIAVFPDDGGDGDELLLNADRAMFRAKRSGQDAARLSGR